ncbi:MAG: glycosyltransferase family 4 protein [Thermomonas sp.]
MRVLLTATSYPSDEADWKGLFILRMVEALSARDDVELSAWLPPGPVPAGVARATTEGDEAWLQGLLEDGGIAQLLRRRPVRGCIAAMGLLRRERAAFARTPTDAYHANWLQNALALPADGVPALLTVLGTDMQLLRLPGMRALLRRKLRGRAVAICPNAEWMLPALHEAFGDIATVRCVPFGIDARWYALERRFEGGGVPAWLCVSRITADKIGPLFDWTAPYFADGGGELHLFGPMQDRLELPEWVRWHGPATPDALRDEWFPRAHGLITLSRHAEGRPQVMLEALASGLPIVASRLPAHDDLLAGGEGGVLCASAGEAQAALRALADPAANRALGLHGRARMQAGIGTWGDCAERYVTLYRALLDQARG